MSEKIEDVVVSEETAAAQTLKTHSSVTKSDLLSQMMKHFAGMKKEELGEYLAKTLADKSDKDEVKSSADDNSAKNKSSVNMNPSDASAKIDAFPSVKEDVEDLFGGEELSEEFKERTSTLFEAALHNRMTIELARLEEEYETKLNEEVDTQVSEAIEELHGQVNQYIDYVAEKWLEDNMLAIEEGFRVEVTESFISGLKNLFTESYIDVPSEKLDVVEELESMVSELEVKLEESVSETIKLRKEIQESNVSSTFESVVEGLTDTQVEKMKELSESVEFEDVESYARKLTMIKEQFFAEDKKSRTQTGLINEESIGNNDAEEQAVVIPEEMKHYVSAISRTSRR